ncbi:MAG: methyltransferase domain-containing protein [bacterium]|nr:methyltransferase domain-containing protein [bacterium]
MSNPDETSASRRQDLGAMPGHRLLARMGKQVLRPGGRKLTDDLLAELDISAGDHVVELAPGAGATAKLVFERNPSGYTGIERDEQAAAQVNAKAKNYRYQCIVGTAHETRLSSRSCHVVLCEAHLAMQTEDRMRKIADEAFRILRPGGRFGIHELCLRPDSLEAESQERVREELARATQAGVHPLTAPDWEALLVRAGFQIRYQSTVAMRILEPLRLIKDEGIASTARIVLNILRTPAARQRVLAMRRMFRQHAQHLGAVAIVAVKPKG